MLRTIVAIHDGEAEIMHEDDGAQAIIFNLDIEELYIFNKNLLCIVTAVNDNGTVEVKCVDSLDDDDKNVGQKFTVNAESLDFYGEDTDGIYSEADDFESDDE